MHLPCAGFVPFGRFSPPRKPDLSFPVWPVAALMGSLVSLCVGSSFAKTLFPAMGAEGITVDKLEDVGPALKKAIDLQMNHGKTTLIEALINQELGEPFRRDAMKKPVEVAGISKADMRPQKA